jgi:hypothetical protein
MKHHLTVTETDNLAAEVCQVTMFISAGILKKAVMYFTGPVLNHEDHIIYLDTDADWSSSFGHSSFLNQLEKAIEDADNRVPNAVIT